MSIQSYYNFEWLKEQGTTGNGVGSVIRVTGYVRWLRVMVKLGYFYVLDYLVGKQNGSCQCKLESVNYS